MHKCLAGQTMVATQFGCFEPVFLKFSWWTEMFGPAEDAARTGMAIASAHTHETNMSTISPRNAQ
jgi:hypothetical protein